MENNIFREMKKEKIRLINEHTEYEKCNNLLKQTIQELIQSNEKLLLSLKYRFERLIRLNNQNYALNTNISEKTQQISKKAIKMSEISEIEKKSIEKSINRSELELNQIKTDLKVAQSSHFNIFSEISNLQKKKEKLIKEQRNLLNSIESLKTRNELNSSFSPFSKQFEQFQENVQSLMILRNEIFKIHKEKIDKDRESLLKKGNGHFYLEPSKLLEVLSISQTPILSSADPNEFLGRTITEIDSNIASSIRPSHQNKNNENENNNNIKNKSYDDFFKNFNLNSNQNEVNNHTLENDFDKRSPKTKRKVIKYQPNSAKEKSKKDTSNNNPKQKLSNNNSDDDNYDSELQSISFPDHQSDGSQENNHIPKTILKQENKTLTNSSKKETAANPASRKEISVSASSSKSILITDHSNPKQLPKLNIDSKSGNEKHVLISPINTDRKHENSSSILLSPINISMKDKAPASKNSLLNIFNNGKNINSTQNSPRPGGIFKPLLSQGSSLMSQTAPPTPHRTTKASMTLSANEKEENKKDKESPSKNKEAKNGDNNNGPPLQDSIKPMAGKLISFTPSTKTTENNNNNTTNEESNSQNKNKNTNNDGLLLQDTIKPVFTQLIDNSTNAKTAENNKNKNNDTNEDKEEEESNSQNKNTNNDGLPLQDTIKPVFTQLIDNSTNAKTAENNKNKNNEEANTKNNDDENCPLLNTIKSITNNLLNAGHGSQQEEANFALLTDRKSQTRQSFIAKSRLNSLGLQSADKNLVNLELKVTNLEQTSIDLEEELVKLNNALMEANPGSRSFRRTKRPLLIREINLNPVLIIERQSGPFDVRDESTQSEESAPDIAEIKNKILQNSMNQSHIVMIQQKHELTKLLESFKIELKVERMNNSRRQIELNDELKRLKIVDPLTYYKDLNIEPEEHVSDELAMKRETVYTKEKLEKRIVDMNSDNENLLCRINDLTFVTNELQKKLTLMSKEPKYNVRGLCDNLKNDRSVINEISRQTAFVGIETKHIENNIIKFNENYGSAVRNQLTETTDKMKKQLNAMKIKFNNLRAVKEKRSIVLSSENEMKSLRFQQQDILNIIDVTKMRISGTISKIGKQLRSITDFNIRVPTPPPFLNIQEE